MIREDRRGSAREWPQSGAAAAAAAAARAQVRPDSLALPWLVEAPAHLLPSVALCFLPSEEVAQEFAKIEFESSRLLRQIPLPSF